MISHNQANMPTTTHGYLISVEIAERRAMSPEQVAMRFSDALAFVEGIGTVDVDYLGEVDVVKAQQEHKNGEDAQRNLREKDWVLA